MKTFHFILALSFLVLMSCDRKNIEPTLTEEQNIKEQHGRLCKTYEVFAEQLKQDPSDYVRRSVANHLNDISKDQPELMLEICQRWFGQHRTT